MGLINPCSKYINNIFFTIVLIPKSHTKDLGYSTFSINSKLDIKPKKSIMILQDLQQQALQLPISDRWRLVQSLLTSIEQET